MDRPAVLALVAYYAEPFGLMSTPKIVPLDEAAMYHELGFAVLIDPETEQALAAWERLHQPRGILGWTGLA